MPQAKPMPAGGGPKESTMPPGMPSSIDQGLPQFGTGQGIGGGEMRPAAAGMGSPFARNKGFADAFKNIPQLDKST